MFKLKILLPNQAIHYPRLLISAMVGVLIFFSVLATCDESYAAPAPKAALVTNVSGVGVKFKKTGFASQSAEAWKTMLRELNEDLIVPAQSPSSAILKGISKNTLPIENQHLIGPTVSAISRSMSYDTRYRFPCIVAAGNGFIGWRLSTETNDRGCVSPGMRLLARSLQSERISVNEVQYCSAVSDSGKGWGVSSSWGLSSSEDPCKKALERCHQMDSSSDCSVVNSDKWSIQDRDLVVSLECADRQLPPLTGTGRTIANTLLAQLEERAKVLGATSCVLDVYQPDKLIVSPASEKLTLFRFDNLGSGRLVVDALAGDIIVKSARQPQGLLVEQERSYYSDGEGGGRIGRSEREEIAKAPATQAFLKNEPRLPPSNDTSISRDVAEQITAEIKEYQEVLRQFLN